MGASGAFGYPERGATPRIFSPPPHFDLLIRGGHVVDGTGKEAFRADIGVSGDRVKMIARGVPQKAAGPGGVEATARTVIDASERIICPGFIDIHSHTDLELLVSPPAQSKIRQGVTTELSGNCGFSVFPRGRNSPLPDDQRSLLEHNGIEPWSDLGGYQTALEQKGIVVNHASLVGHGTVRGMVLGDAGRAPTSLELVEMQTLIEAAMAQGAFGLSSGLEYAPGRFASTAEMIALCRTAGRAGGLYATHMRSEDTRLMEAFAEALHIAMTAALPLQISHLKAAGESNYHKIPRILDMLDAARRRGEPVTADRYPYTAFSTTLSIMFPEWALADGRDAFISRLRDPALRRRMRAETLEKVAGNNHWDSMLIAAAGNPGRRHLVGKTIRAAAEKAGEDPYDFACGLLVSEGGDLSIIGFGMDESNTLDVLCHPQVMCGSDGVALSAEGPLSGGMPHPRSYGAFPRFLRLCVREKGRLSLPEAVRRMTALPAAKLGLADRGVIREGAAADLVVLDPESVRDLATYTLPEAYPLGINHVVVNGRLTISQGFFTGETAGRVLRRG